MANTKIVRLVHIYETSADRDYRHYVCQEISNISTRILSKLQERAIILSSTNEQVNKINGTVLLKFNAPTNIYYSVDTVINREGAVH